MIFTTHQKNLAQLKATIKAYGEAWIHGDGNIYRNEKKSDHRKNFANPDKEEASYRLKFTDASQVPATKEDLDALLMKAKNREILTERKATQTNGVDNVTVDSEDEEINGGAEKGEFVLLSDEDFAKLTPSQKGVYTKKKNAAEKKELS